MYIYAAAANLTCSYELVCNFWYLLSRSWNNQQQCRRSSLPISNAL